MGVSQNVVALLHKTYDMPKSKQRSAHKHHHPNQTNSTLDTGPKTPRSARAFTMPISALFGAGIGWFAAGDSILWIIAGALAGLGIGHFIGLRMDEAFSRK